MTAESRYPERVCRICGLSYRSAGLSGGIEQGLVVDAKTGETLFNFCTGEKCHQIMLFAVISEKLRRTLGMPRINPIPLFPNETSH